MLIARDVSERDQMSARVAAVDRMVAVGTLAAGAAHEINNPLAYVAANAEFVRGKLTLLRETLGEAWMTPKWFRFGASSLANDILMQLQKEADIEPRRIARASFAYGGPRWQKKTRGRSSGTAEFPSQ